MQDDAFVFDINLKSKSADRDVTRRTILSVAASLLDHLGFLASISLIPKMLMQELCSMKLDWDDPVPEEL